MEAGGYPGAVTFTKQRVVAGVLALMMAFGLGACADDDGPPTTAPGGTETTEPVGS
jgi:hypothetical protein